MKPDTQSNTTPPAQWQGIEEYLNSDAFRETMQDEFPEQAAEWTDPVTRRHFLNIMGASLALAGIAGCSPRPAPRRQIFPYNQQPVELTPGVPLFFATTFTLAGVSTGVMVRSHEGRPVKVEGNPHHPGCANPTELGDKPKTQQGRRHAGSSVIAQASLLDLYDPDRSRNPTYLGQPSSFTAALQATRDQLNAQRAKGGAGLRILSGAVAADTSLAAQLRDLLAEFPAAKWCQYEPSGLRPTITLEQGKEQRSAVATYDFTKADVVVSLDADFLGSTAGHVRYSRDFSKKRRVRYNTWRSEDGESVRVEEMSRVYAIESMPSITGSAADHRLPIPSSQVEAFARELAAKLGVPGVPTDSRSATPEAQKWAAVIARDLEEDDRRVKRKPGTTVVVPGDHQPPAVHALAHAINQKLGNIGSTVHLLPNPAETVKPEQRIDFAPLVAEMAAGTVETLLILGAPNPAYATFADVDFAAALAKVPFSLHLGTHQDETAVLCQWHVNEAHYLETWGDGRAFDGTASIQQPLIDPIFGGTSVLEFVAQLRSSPIGGPSLATSGRDIVRTFWQQWWTSTPAGQALAAATKTTAFEPFWQEAVRAGVIEQSAATPLDLAKEKWTVKLASPSPAVSSGLEINFRIDPALFDGRYANNGWLQEVPKPITKITWDNALFVSPRTADKLGINQKDFRWTAGEHGRAEVPVVELKFAGGTVKAPVWVLPGHADDVVTVHLGHGRERVGKVGYSESEPNADGKMARGFNAYVLRPSAQPWFAAGASVTRTSDTYFLACTQGRGEMSGTKDPITGKPIERRPARKLTRAMYEADPHFARLPPSAVGEAELINKNVPGAAGAEGYDPEHSGVQGRRGLSSPHHHEEGEGHKHGHEDKRLHPLTMYNPNDTLYPEGSRQASTRRWAMAIDLGTCIGCNSCVIACQSENNIPVVGKREVTRGHEMFWIRIDRYYEGDPSNPDVTHFQPVPCQQCEKAPCEVVCPVGATVHSSDGLNDMVYNRCVGTRYCSNNCPYKVRRFNFLTFQDWDTATFKLGRNPDVSVRSRGVMEKCTYCVQRIRYGEIVAEREGREIRDLEVRTACQTACPTGAIMFGNLDGTDADDPKQGSRVAKWKSEPTNYGLLAELNTMPRTTYLAGVRNPNPELSKG